MSNVEIIEQLENTIGLIKQDGKDWLDDRDIPILEVCIKALIALDKIRAEVTAIDVNGQVDAHTMFIRTAEQVKQMTLGIIDKYKAESELSDMTNGEILKTIFPSITEEFNNRPDEIIVSGLDVNEKVFQLDWWNKLYKENKSLQ